MPTATAQGSSRSSTSSTRTGSSSRSSDYGEGFDPPGDARRALDEDELSEGGLGIAIIEALADELEIRERAPGGSRLRFVKHLRSRVAGRRSLIIASNRGPVTFDRGPDGRRVVRRGGGGLVTALRGLLEHHDVTWIASATTDEDRVVAAEGSATTCARRPRPARVRRLLQRRREPDALVHPARVVGTAVCARTSTRLPRGLAATTRPSTACSRT